MPTIDSADEAKSVARLIQSGQITGSARDTAMQALRDFDTRQTSQAAPQTRQKPGYGVSDYLSAIPETAAKLGSGLVASPIAGLAGLGTLAGRTLGLTNSDPATVVQTTQNALTYQPRTRGGQDISNAIGYLPGKFAQGAEWAGGKVTDATGSPALGTLTDTGIQSLPLLLGARAPVARAATAPTLAPEVAAATSAGLKLTPEQAGAGIMGRVTQSLTGSAKLERSLSKQNAPVVNNLAAQDIGAKDLSASSIAAAKAPANAVYKQVASAGQVPIDAQFRAEIGNISNPGGGSFSFDVPPGIDKLKTGYGSIDSFDAADAVSKVRQLRADASKNIRAPNAPEQNSLGYAQRQVADAIENQLDRHIQAQGGGNLIDQYRSARVQLAKIHSVEDALDGSNISAKALARQADRGVPLSGNLRTIANAYQSFDRSLQDVSKLRDSGPFGVLDLGFGAAAGLAHPGATAAVLARPLARAALASGPYQRFGIQRAPLTQPVNPGLLGIGRTAPLLTGGLMDERQQ